MSTTAIRTERRYAQPGTAWEQLRAVGRFAAGRSGARRPSTSAPGSGPTGTSAGRLSMAPALPGVHSADDHWHIAPSVHVAEGVHDDPSNYLG